MTKHRILKHKEPPAARQHSITCQNTGNHLLPDNTASCSKTQGTTCCQTTQHHVPKHKEPPAARQHSITPQNVGNHLLPDNIASHPKMLGTTCCQTAQHHVPKHREPLAARQHSITSQNTTTQQYIQKTWIPSSHFDFTVYSCISALITTCKQYCVIMLWKCVTFTYKCFFYQQRRQYIPCFSDEVKLNYPKKSSLNAEQQSLFLQLMIKYAKKGPFPTPVDEKELQQYKVCVFHIYMYVYIYMKQGCTNPGYQVTWTAKFFVVAPNICGSPLWNVLQVAFLALRILKWHLDFWKICALLIFMVILLGSHTPHHYDGTDRHPMVLVTCCTSWIYRPEIFLIHGWRIITCKMKFLLYKCFPENLVLWRRGGHLTLELSCKSGVCLELHKYEFQFLSQ